MKMTFSEFAKLLYNHIGNRCGADVFTYDLLTNILDPASNTILEELQPDTLRKYYNGRRSIAPLAKRVLPFIEPTCFSVYLERKCSDATAANIAADLEEYGVISRPDELFDDMADLFNQILRGSTHRNKNNEELEQYFRYLQEKYYRIKTLLYFSEPRPIYDFYIPNDLYEHGNYRGKKRIQTELMLLSFRKKFVVITGTGGLGKTMLMHHLVLTLVKRYDKYQKLPIVIQLKDFDADCTDLIAYIKERIQIQNLEEYVRSGKCVFLLDGMDEIKSRYLTQFEKELSDLADRYPENNFILSSRPISDFIALSKFDVYELAPFTKEQALQLIDQLVYRPESPELKASFRREVDESLWETHRDFVENPLLLTIMLMTYERYARIPYKRHVFYRDAFFTLAEKHDATKIGFERAYRTKMTPEEFALVLEEFCTRTYFDEKFEFTDEEFAAYFDKLKVLERINKRFSVQDLKMDFTLNLCIMYYESGKYSFIHRSFQEYFCALHLSKAFDSGFRKIWNFFEEKKSRLCTDYTFDMLYDLAPLKIDRLIFKPYLTELFQRCHGSGEEQYWDFLEEVYPEINYTVGDVVNPYFNLPSSYIYDMILHKKGTERKYVIDKLPYDEDYEIETYLYVEKDGETDCVNAADLEPQEQQAYDLVEVSGHNCRVLISEIREEESNLHQAMLDPYFPYMLEYREMKKCLYELEDLLTDSASAEYEEIF